MLIGNKAELVTKIVKLKDIPIELIIDSYNDLKSSYKVAKKFNTSATAIKRVLKELNILRNQKHAVLERDNSHCGKYERTVEHKETLSNVAKTRVKEKNPFYNKTHSDETKKVLSEHSKKRTGERNPNYKDGSYQRKPRDFKQAEFTRLRNFVFNRDDYTCKYCGCIGGHLHAHHKIPYWFKKEAYLDVDNLITVCTKCHFNAAHMGDWNKFDISLIDDRLIKRYSLDRERLNELATKFGRCDSPTSTNINEGGETNRNG